MLKKYKVGDFVLHDDIVSSIENINEEIIKLHFGKIVSREDIKPVPINSIYDRNITLLFENLRAPIITSGERSPISPRKNYMECFINSTTSVRDVVEKEGFEYVHELQEWLRNNYSEALLRTKV